MNLTIKPGASTRAENSRGGAVSQLPSRSRGPFAAPMIMRAPILLAALILLLLAMAAGLARMGWPMSLSVARLSAEHGPLMISGFLGTLISLERAVALGEAWCFLAPGLTALGALMMVAQIGGFAGPWAIVIGSTVTVAIFGVIVRRQTELFNVAIGLGSIAWLVGNCAWSMGAPIPEMVAWWAAFPVLTICGERLELSRLTSRAASKGPAFVAATVLHFAGLITAWFALDAGYEIVGASLIAFALWMFTYDAARRTIKANALPRFIAVNMLAGAGWLAVSGVLWIAFARDSTALRYDAMLHSLFLGFVFGMIFAHAPVIFPAITGRPMPFRRIFYAHTAMLQASLLMRIAGGDIMRNFFCWRWGGMLNVASILLFIAVTAFAVAVPARPSLSAPH